MSPRFIEDVKRTHTCGALRQSDAGKEAVLFGWVASRRNLGGCVFLDLRDRSGITQVIVDPQESAGCLALASELRPEWVIGVAGAVRSRGANANPRLPTGAVEVLARDIQVFSRSEVPPFLVEDGVDAREELRLSHRFLDLRRPEQNARLQLRHRLVQRVRRLLDREGFLEIETPVLIKSTPGGARNFLVPSRLQPGSFYALAESPQIFKQLLMIAGFDRYAQIVRCFRDEDLRGDRQPEFTQVDLEMSFVVPADVFAVVEQILQEMFEEALGFRPERPFRIMPYAEAMERYGSDKPDTRFGLELRDVTEIVRAHGGGGVEMLQQALADGGRVKALAVPPELPLSRAELDGLEEKVKEMGGRGLTRAKVAADGSWTQTPLAKRISPELRLALNGALEAKPDTVLLFQFGPARQVNTILGGLRLQLGQKFSLVKPATHHLLWVVDFPLFERSEETGAIVASHHPFTAPHPDDLPRLESDPLSVRARAYDLVLDGVEVGGGSIRIHDSETQARIFSVLGIGDEEAREKFSFLLQALRLGAPPHGGLALGLDRLVMLLAGASSIREVIAFPKTQKGQDLMSGAPAPVSPAQLEELHVAPAGPKTH